MAAPEKESQRQSFSYDEVPYESFCYKHTHPDHLYVIGKLFGMNPPDFRTARVLELGCAEGGNLLPYALAFPESKCLGIDLSNEQINEADRLRKKIGLNNVEFRQMDILSADKHWGTFDYIVCHGVFSWVPDNVREKILELCRYNLSPQGIAMISYNAYPGWHFTGAIRDIMKYHTQIFKTPAEKIMQARALLGFMSKNAPKEQKFFKEYLDREIETLSGASDSYIYHDHLESLNQPFYLHEFAGMLERYDLQYLGDTAITTMYLKNMGPDVMRQLSRLPDHIRQQQYADFMTNRRFRMSLITHRNVTLERNVDPGKISDFYLTSLVTADDKNPDLQKPVIFRKREGAGSFTSTDAALTAAFLVLEEASLTPLSVDEISVRVQKKYGLHESERIKQALEKIGIEFAFNGFIGLNASSENFSQTVTSHPRAYMPARLAAKENPDILRLENAVRTPVTSNRFMNLLLSYCDGENNLDELTNKMIVHIEKGEAALPETTISKERASLLIKKSLNMLAESALLTG